MARPKSMPDFAALIDPSSPLPWKEHQRKKPSISLAAGLIMATESPKMGHMTTSPSPLGKVQHGEDWSENLFYAYALKSDYAQSPPNKLTFANASVCDQWWSLVQREYPESTRMGPQMFVLKGDDMQEQIQDNPRFYDLRNKWFCTPGDGTTGTIPLQDYKGHPVSRPTAPAPVVEQKKQDNFDMSALSAALNKMNSMISENSAQIRALSVAQSEGLQRMQEINESNMTQMKALADSQEKLQSIVDQNASHYIALSNSSFANQEQTKSELQSTASQTKALASQTNALASQTKVLAEGQFRLAKTCEGTMRTIENLGTTVARVSDDMSTISSAWSDAGSMSSVSTASAPFGAMARISPPPRKLNRRVKGVWYEYDDNPTTNPSPKKPALLHTPPKSPESRKAGSSALRAPPAKKIA